MFSSLSLHKLSLISAVIFISSCQISPTNTPAPPTTPIVTPATETPTLTPSPNCEPFEVEIVTNSLSSEVVISQEVRLVASTGLDNITYSWRAHRGKVIPGTKNSEFATYIAPQIAGTDSITVQATSNTCGTDDSKLKLTIVLPTATPTDTPLPTPRPTPTATSTPSPVFQISLSEPTNRTCIGPKPNMVFRWEFSRALTGKAGAPGEYFALNIWSNDNTEEKSISWTKEFSYQVDISENFVVGTKNVNCAGSKGCSWNVHFIRSTVPPGEGESGKFEVLSRSDTRILWLRGQAPECPKVEITDTPAPPTQIPIIATVGPRPTP